MAAPKKVFYCSTRAKKNNTDEMSQNSGEPSTSDESMASQEKIAERDEKALKKKTEEKRKGEIEAAESSI